MCREEPDIFLKDEATTIILNCKGHKGNINDEIKNLLRSLV